MSVAGTRRSDRVCLTLLLETEGTDSTGAAFKAPAQTMLISRHGAVILLDRSLEPGQEIEVRRKAAHESHRHGAVKIVGQFGKQEEGYVYGISIADTGNDLWGVEFPPLAESEEAVARMLLECSYCRGREVIYLNELELKGFELSRGIARHCKACGVPSVWTQAPHEDLKTSAPRGNGERAIHNPAADAKRAEGKESTRIKTMLTACIRESGADDELAVCEEISATGARFRSRKLYAPETRIEIAVPYTQGTANIFVSARVSGSEEMPTAGLFRHRIEYLKPDQITRAN